MSASSNKPQTSWQYWTSAATTATLCIPNLPKSPGFSQQILKDLKAYFGPNLENL
jgi:hypothetical protein